MEWSTALPDWERRIVAGESLIPFAPLFPAEAEAARLVFDDLLVVDAPNSPRMGDTARPWVTDFVSAIFGAYDPDVGRRLVSEFFLAISKKNGKSTDAAAIMLTALIRNWRKSAEFLILAPTVEIANNSFYPARDMVRANEELSQLLHVQDHFRTITHRTTGASLKVVAADNEAVGGKKATGILVDELWLFGKRANAENMLREATGGLASRPEGFVIYLSTQSDEAPSGVFKQKLDYARGVRDGRIVDKRFLPVIYEFPPAMVEAEAYREPSNFYVTNPNLGLSVDAEFLERQLRIADEAGIESVAGFLAKHLNVEIGLGLRSNAWAGALFWEQAADPSLTLEGLLARSEVVCAGIDGGGLDDMLALSFIGREVKTGTWLHWAHAWLHPIALERRKKNKTIYEGFEADGDLTIVKEIGQDVEQLADYVKRVDKSGLLERIGVDQAGIDSVVKAIYDRKVAREINGDDRIIAIPQGWRMTSSITNAERKLAQEGAFVHGGTRLMAWCVSNAKVEPKGNAVIITKQQSGSAKIDPVLATLNASALMSLNPAAARRKIHMFTVG